MPNTIAVMKLRYCLILSFFLPLGANAQIVKDLEVSIPTVTINAKLVGKDSVIIPYNSNYEVVQKACTQIIRYGHYNFKLRFFFGKFKDVNAGDSSKIVAEGNFSKNGLKDGHFVLHYLDGHLEAEGNFSGDDYDGDWIFYYPNGNLKSKGRFKAGKYIGKWEMYYEDGSPKLFFDVENGACKIENAWRLDGTKIVNEGNGYYQSNSGAPWAGKLSNGMPDSTWTCKINFGSDTSKGISVIEYFKNNRFYKGYSKSGNFSRYYDDKSAISLLPELPLLKIKHSQYLDIRTSCNGVEIKEAYIKIFDKIIYQKFIPLNGSSYYKEKN